MKPELIVDNFAGGGGASTGIFMATGRHPDIAINHDREALAMHAANHPKTLHLCEDVFAVNPRKLCAGRKVGLAWFSPDCTFHSKARGSKPFRDRNKARRRRGLAGVVLKWAAQVRPRKIILENVEEFQKWGPLGADGKPDPEKQGTSFNRWASRLRNLGYAVELRQLRACDYGAPTTRKRLFIIATSDGVAPVWPAPTHGDAVVDLFSPKLKPYRTAAECIDWTLATKSIFDRKKPLADKTMRRIARGVVKYVIKEKSPFIVPATHGDSRGRADGRARGVNEPLQTLTTLGAQAHVVGAAIVPVTHVGGDRVQSIGEPLRTITTAQRGEFAIVGADLISTPFLKRDFGTSVGSSISEPARTTTCDGGGHQSLVETFLVRTAHGEKTKSGKKRGKGAHSMQEPLPTVMTSGDLAVVSCGLIHRGNGERQGQDPRTYDIKKPHPTIVAGGIKTGNVVAFLAKNYGGHETPGSSLDSPMATVTAKDHHSLIEAHLEKVCGPGTVARARQVWAFLIKFYGTDQDPSLAGPLHTITTKDRFALITVHGVDYVMVDIHMRMLVPQELFRAQGFPPDYEISKVAPYVPTPKKRTRRAPRPRTTLTKTAQVRMCGNSVSPVMACALVGANYAGAPQRAEVA